MKLRRIASLFTASVVAVSTMLANFPATIAFAAAENEWVDNGDGSYSATINGAAEIDSLSIDTSDVDWENTQYISVKYTANATSMPILVAEDSNDVWTMGKSGWQDDGGEYLVYFGTDGQEFKNLRLEMWHLTDGMSMTVSDITFHEEKLTDIWYPMGDKWVLNRGTAESFEEFNFFDLGSVEDWSAVRYISADVYSDGKVFPAIGGNLGLEENWVNGSYMMMENGTGTFYLDTNGTQITGANVQFWGAYQTGEKDEYGNDITYPLEVGQRVEISNITFSTEERTTITGETNTWFEQDGVYYYINGDTAIPESGELNFPIDISSVESWEGITEIRATVEAINGVANFCIAGTIDGNWASGESSYMEGCWTTLSLPTNGGEVSSAEVALWSINDEGTALEAGSIIAVRDIEFVGEYSEKLDWYANENNDWVFSTDRDLFSGDGWSEVPNLDIDISSVEDWSEIKYVSVDIRSNGSISSALGGGIVNSETGDEEWTCSEGVYFNDAEATIYFPTNGQTVNYLNLMLWPVDQESGAVLYGGSEVIVSNITFSTEERTTITGETNTWFEQDGVNYYINGSEPLSEFDLEAFIIDVSYVEDWSDILAVELDVEAVSGNAFFNFRAAVNGGNLYLDDYNNLHNARTTLTLYVGGQSVNELMVQFWPMNEEYHLLDANGIIAIKDVRFVEFPETDVWFERDGHWFYKNGSEAVQSIPDLEIDLDTYNYDMIPWYDVGFINAAVSSDGAISPVFGVNKIINDEWCWRMGVSAPTNGGTTYPYYRTNGDEIGSASIVFWGMGENNNVLEAGQCLCVHNIMISEYDPPHVVDQWVDDGNGNWYYQSDNDGSQIWGYNFDLNDVPVDNWENIQYISVDVQVTEGNVKPHFSTSFDGVYTTSGSKAFSGTEYETLYFETNGRVPERLNIDFDAANDDGLAILPGAKVYMKNFVFSTEALDHSNLKDMWYQENGSWCYVKGDSSGDVSELNIDTSSVEDWSKIKYISMDVTVSEGNIGPAAMASVGGMHTSTGNKNFTGTQTLYLVTNGKNTESLSVSFAGVNDDGSAALANAQITISNITFSEEEMDYSILKDQWYELDDGWHYVKGNESGNIDGIRVVDTSSVEDWSKIKYISTWISVSESYISPKFTTNINGNFVGGGNKTIGDRSLIFLVTNGQTPDDIYIDFYGIWQNDGNAVAAGAEIVVEPVYFSENPLDYSEMQEEWYLGEDNAWHYNNDDLSGDILELPIDIESVDWSEIRYVSADVSVCIPNSNAVVTINPAFSGSFNQEDTPGNSKLISTTSPSTIYLRTNGLTPDWLNISFLWADGEIAVTANSHITISNITYSRDELDFSIVKDEWIQDPTTRDWHYNNGSADRDTIAPLNIDVNSIDDWSTVKYISANVTVTGGDVNPVFNYLVDDVWFNSNDAHIFTDENTNTASGIVYILTHGDVPEEINLGFNWVEDGVAVYADSSITVSDIYFSTQDFDYTLVKNRWVGDEDGNWWYTNGDKDIESADPLSIDISGINNWEDFTYISADVTVTGGSAVPVFRSKIDGEYRSGTQNFIGDGETATIVIPTCGKTPEYLDIELWWTDDELALTAGTTVMIGNFLLNSDPVNVKEFWYESPDGTWNYVDSGDGYSENDISHTIVSDMSADTKYIKFDVTVDGYVDVNVNLFEEDGSFRDAYPQHIEDGKATIYVFTYGDAWNFADLNICDISENAIITVDNIVVSNEDITDYEDITGQWIQTGEKSFYYNHGDKEACYVEGPFLMANDIDISDVQSVSITARYENENFGTIKLAVSGTDATDEWNPGMNFPLASTEQTITRNYRGMLRTNPMLDAQYVTPGTKIYVSDITFGYEEVPEAEVAAGEILLDDNQTALPEWGVQHDINYPALANLEKAGTLKIYAEKLDGYEDNSIWAIWNVWGDPNIGFKWATEEPETLTGSVYEIPVTETELAYIRNNPYSCDFAVQGCGIRITKITFMEEKASTVPQNVKASAGDTKVQVKWDAVEGAESYRVMVWDGTKWTGYNTTATSNMVRNLTNGKKYAFAVKTYANGAYSDTSEIVYATPVAASIIPTGVKAGAGDAKVQVKWNAVTGATSYRVMVWDGTKWTGYSTTSTSYMVRNLTNNKKYAFAVKAYVNG
ncbi:MAG: fibronectin type III domain-containing protein, partial [Oscillospiraceae bacterium]|nr:fibronectin type III domain-containing protein [Oscillospiraceae bacterium]